VDLKELDSNRVALVLQNMEHRMREMEMTMRVLREALQPTACSILEEPCDT
jgi:hypothetical protein